MTTYEMLGDVLAAIVVVVANLICWTLSGRLVARILPGSDTATRVSGQLVLIWSTIVLAAMPLGFLQVLSPIVLYALVLTIWLGGWCGIGICFKGKDEAKLHDGVENYGKERRGTLGNVVLVGLAAIGVAQVVQMGIVTLPHDWDTLAYHLPIVDSWIQTGSLINQRCAFWYVPGNNELLALWFGGMFSGDFWAQLNNLPVVVLLSASLMALSNELGISRFWQLVIILSCMANTPVLRQLSSVENDVAVGALFIASALFSVRLVRNSSSANHADLLFLSLSLGLLAGIKYYALGYAGVIFLVSAMFLCVKSGLRVSFYSVTGMGTGCLILGGPWYIRNWIIAGSPLYPKGLRMLGIPDAWETLRPELASSCLLFGSTFETTRLLLLAWITQAGPLMTLSAIALVPTIVFFLVRYSQRLKSPPDGNTDNGIVQNWMGAAENAIAMVQVFALGAMLIYWITPNVIETDFGSRNMLLLQYQSVRFGYAFGVIAAIVFLGGCSSIEASLLKQFRKVTFPPLSLHCTLLLRSMFGIGSLMSLVWVLLPQYGLRNWIHDNYARVWQHPSLDIPPIDWAIITISAFFSFLLLREMGQAWTRVWPSLIVATAFVIATPYLATHWHRHFMGHFATLFIEDLDTAIKTYSARGSPICACEYRYYGMLGSRRENAVYRPLFVASREELDEFLSSNGVQFVIAPTVDAHWSGTYKNCLGWIEDMKDQFEFVGQEGTKKMFRKISNE